MSDERMTLYLSTELKESIETQSDRADQTQNEWVRDAIRRKIKAEKQESALEATNAEKRLEAIAQETSEKMIESVRQYQHLMAVTGAYSITNFQILKRLDDGLSETLIEDMFSESHERLQRRSADVVPDDLDHSTAESDTRASESRAQDQQDSNISPPDSLDESDDDKTDIDDLL